MIHKKKNFLLLLFLIVIFSITGCNTSNTPTTSTHETSTKSNNAKTKTVMDSARELDIKYFQNSGSMKGYVEWLQSEVPDNEYTKEINSIYKKLNIDNKSDFEKDFLDFYLYVKRNKRFNFEDIEKIWKVGYDENNNLINGDDDKNFRTFVLYVPTCKDFQYYTFPIFHFVYKGEDKGMERSINHKADRTYVGIGDDEKKGTYYLDGGDEALNGVPYELLEQSDIEQILNDNNELITLLDEYYEEVFISEKEAYNKERQEENERNKPKEPQIGMTKDEVEKGAWGYPDSINIDKYAWGIHEQWVYEHKGYVYFEDGIVTAVQIR